MLIPLEILRRECTLTWDGIHGINHWQRVKENGLKLAARTGADALVVELFAYLHDLKRLNDGVDPHHGRRAAEFVRQIQGTHILLSQVDLESLCYACERHTDGLTEADHTVQTCWDADRLDLGRVGIRPDNFYLCTEAAKDPEIRQWAYMRSLGSNEI